MRSKEESRTTRDAAPAPAPSREIQVARSLGNQSYGGLVQAKLTVGAPDDPHEREADRVADEVMRMPDRGAVAVASHAPDVPARIEALEGGGRPLDASARRFFEPRFGVDLGAVRVHTGSPAAQAARVLRARAFTYGSDVAFAPGEYAPDTREGRRLLAHELTHVLQQRRGSAGLSRGVAQAQPVGREDLQERAARGTDVLAEVGGPIPVRASLPPATIARNEDEGDDGVLECLWGIVAGEFIEDPGLCQIVFETLVGLIPYVDQAMDVRDLVAHIYFMGWRGQHDSFWRWVGLVFTLIGMIPELGTLIKGVSKTIRRYLDPILEGVGALFDFLSSRARRFGVDLSGEASRVLRELRELLTRSWDRVKGKARTAWSELLGWFQRQLDRVPDILASVSTRVRQAKAGIRAVRRSTGEFFERAFRRAHKIFDDLYIELASRFGRRRVDIRGAADVAHEVGQARRFGFLRGGGEFEFLGNFQQGIEGFLRRRGGGADIPVSLKDFSGTGRLANIIGRINRNSRQIVDAGFNNAQLFASLRQYTSAAVIEFIERGPIRNMPNDTVFTNLVFDTMDGVVEVTAAGVRRIR